MDLERGSAAVWTFAPAYFPSSQDRCESRSTIIWRTFTCGPKKSTPGRVSGSILPRVWKFWERMSQDSSRADSCDEKPKPGWPVGSSQESARLESWDIRSQNFH